MRDYGGKTAEQRRAERRARLLDAGFALFGTQGYAATSVRALLREAGLQDRYFAESFAGMEELLAEVYDKAHEAAFEEIIDAVDPGATLVERLHQMVEANARKLETDPRYARVALIEVLGAGPLVEKHRQRGLRQYADAVASVLPQPQPQRGLDRTVVARALVAGVNGVFTDWLTNSPSLTREQIVEHAMLLVRGVLRETFEASVG
ncbi:TetR/AcrR family transcriptional regulator [Nonomuraea sp. B12E4]|uniref:TetR/AcrR family transcriptional regulator n=1 Tax=Nonomuraea sp. B12E4 TaxID=3153564 RepID=UPI00325D2E2E